MTPPDPPAAPPPPGPSEEDVERRLGMVAEDRSELPGLHDLNARRVPRLRFFGVQAIVGFAAAHNLLLPEVAPSWALFAWVALGMEAYAVAQWVVLARYFARFPRAHLGTVFLAVDLVAFTVVIYATGAHESLMWPLYLVRVADQMWTGRRRAAVFGLAAALSYAALHAWVAWVEGVPVEPGSALLRIGALLALTGYLVAVSGLPWDLRNRARASKALILALEDQSRALDRELDRARRASRAKSHFLSRVRHELRTPLSSVLGLTDLLLEEDDGTTAEERRGNLLRIRKNAEHLLDVIREILDIAGIEEGRLTLQAGEVDLENLVRATVGHLERRYGRPDVRVFVSFPRVLDPLKADEARVRQVLTNLIGNALRFTRTGWIRVEVTAVSGGGRPAEIRVVDTGPGLDADQLAAVLAPPDVSAGGDGPTLGLSISRALCELMGFRLLATSTPGEGSTFIVDLLGEPA